MARPTDQSILGQIPRVSGQGDVSILSQIPRVSTDPSLLSQSPRADQPLSIAGVLEKLDQPIAPVARAARGLARFIDPAGAFRGEQERLRGDIFALPGTLVKGIRAIPDVARLLVQEPAATVRGFLAGTVEAAGQRSPLDILEAVSGVKGLGALRTARQAPVVVPQITQALPPPARPRIVGELDAPIREARRSRLRQLTATEPTELGLTPTAAARDMARTGIDAAEGVRVLDSIPRLEDAFKATEALPPISTVRSMTLRESRRMFGAEEAARRAGTTTQAVRELTQDISRIPLRKEVAELDYQYLRRTLDPAGKVSPKLLTRIALGGTGAAIGYTQGETADERVANAIIFGTGGMLVPSLLKSGQPAGTVVRALKDGARDLGPSLGRAFEKWRYFSMLARPGSIARASGGALSGTAIAAMTQAARGDISGSARILGHLLVRSPVEYLRALRSPASIARPVIEQGRVPASGGLLSLPTRLISAADHAAVNAMKAGGIETEEALRYTLSGEPTSAIGRDFFHALNNHFLGRLVSPFSRVSIVGAERGLEFSPLGPVFRTRIRSAPGVAPLSRGESIARAAVGTAISVPIGGISGVVAGAIHDEKAATRLRRNVAAFTGPAALGTLLTSAWAEAATRNPGMPENIPPAVLQALLYELPLVEESDIRRIPQSLIPGFAGPLFER